jgi:TRAP-type C4-dicarboxylate transport system permease large subunit
VQRHIDSRIQFLLTLNFLLLVVRYLMDTFSAITVTVPLNHIDPEPCVQEFGTSGSVQGERGNPPH